MPSGDVFSRVCDGADFCDCGSCDWPDRKKKKSGKDEYVHIPPSVAAPGGQRRE